MPPVLQRLRLPNERCHSRQRQVNTLASIIRLGTKAGTSPPIDEGAAVSDSGELRLLDGSSDRSRLASAKDIKLEGQSRQPAGSTDRRSRA